jgi:tetratricopeptide (TPR) repeat protein
MEIKASRWLGAAALCAVCALVLGTYGYLARSGVVKLFSPDPAETYYNLLVRGFEAGHLNLPKDVPPGLARLADPYDPDANSTYRTHGLHDLSYFRGKLYLYFGATPALVLFWPVSALTGRYLWNGEATFIFCAAAFLIGAGLLFALRRKHFPEVGDGVVVSCALAFGLATGVPLLLAQSDVHEVAIACGYLLVLLALAAIWRASARPDHRGRCLAAASVAYGLAVAARPSLLPGALCLLVPIGVEMRRRATVVRQAICALAPIAVIGLGLLLYNYERFGQPLEFGQYYQLAGDRQDAARHFSPGYFWFNFRVYFLEPVRWTRVFPFAGRPCTPPLPSGHAPPEDPFGALTSLPVLWLALAGLWVWRDRAAANGALRVFVMALSAFFGASVVTLCLFYGSCSRYEAEFVPELALLAIVGIFAVEQKLAGRPSLLWMARCGWGLLMAFSVAFNVSACLAKYAEVRNHYAGALMDSGRLAEAIPICEEVVRLKPDLAEAHNNLGVALVQQPGKLNAAIGQFGEAVRLKPDFAEAHYNRGNALYGANRTAEAVAELEEALRLKPDFVTAHFILGAILDLEGQIRQAAAQYAEALRWKPDFADAHLRLAGALLRLPGRREEARSHLEAVLRLQPGNEQARQMLAGMQALQP